MAKGKFRIRYYDAVCGMADVFKSEAFALAAAESESKRRGYTMEVVWCDKAHVQRNGTGLGPGFHVQGKYFH